MAVIRVNKTKDYTVMSNYHLKDKRLSLKAKGLLSVLLSLPDEWNYTIKGLVSICSESKNAVNSALNELKKFGYLRVDKIKPNKENGGKYKYIYNIFEKPFEKQEEENQGIENQDLENQGLENQGIENQGIENQGLENQGLENQGIENHPLYKYTNILNTNILNTNILNTNNKRKKEINKERKKVSKQTSYEDILSAITDDNLKDLYVEYIKMRQLIKSPLTNRALVMLINKVNKLAPNDINKQTQMLETAILKNWKSVYPVAEETKHKNDGWCFSEEDDNLDFLK